MSKTRRTIGVKIYRDDFEMLKRRMPDNDGFTFPQRVRLLTKTSLINLEDILNGRRKTR